MDNTIVAGILLLIIGLSAAYVVKAKKSGQKCIGCPHGGCCKNSDGFACCCGVDSENA